MDGGLKTLCVATPRTSLAIVQLNVNDALRVKQIPSARLAILMWHIAAPSTRPRLWPLEGVPGVELFCLTQGETGARPLAERR
jgi:hypothetical protein